MERKGVFARKVLADGGGVVGGEGGDSGVATVTGLAATCCCGDAFFVCVQKLPMVCLGRVRSLASVSKGFKSKHQILKVDKKQLVNLYFIR